MTSLNAMTRESLLTSNEEYRRLNQEHSELESRLSALSQKPVLSAAEQIEESRLKKIKLAGRDRMEQIARSTH